MNKELTHVGYKIKIFPTKDQEIEFKKYFGACRYVYNLAIDMQEESYRNNNQFMKFISINNKFNQIKSSEGLSWLKEYDSTSLKLILKDNVQAFMNFFKGNCRYPKRKNKKDSKMQFPVRSERISIYDDKIRIPSIGLIDCVYHDSSINGNGDKNNKTRTYLKYCNTRISFDGSNYFISFTIPIDDNHIMNSCKKYGHNSEYIYRQQSKSIGIDLGCKGNNWIVDSAGNRISLPDFSKEKKKLKRFHKKLARQLSENTRREPRRFETNNPDHGYSKNEIKTIAKISKYYHKITNKRNNKVHEYCKILLELKPASVVLETISVKDMLLTESKMSGNKKKLKNSKVMDASLYTTQDIITYTMVANNIPVIYADEQYPSTQLCSCCGFKQDIHRKRYYRCPICGNVMDRDENAANNLSKLGIENQAFSFV